MPIATLKPNDRFAFIGKTRSGKTALAMVLAATFARALPVRWEVWWIDTKNDPKDLKALRQWGFRNVASEQDQQTSLLTNAKYFIVHSHNKDGEKTSTVEQVQAICEQAYDRKYVILVIDEYTQAVPSARSAGEALQNVFTRGGGRNVGIIGLTQEPVYVPRQLLSQATHQIMLSVTHGYDVEYLQKMEKAYQVPSKMGDPYGFWWKWTDGGAEITYYENQQVWYDQLNVAMPRPPKELDTVAQT